MIQDHNYLQIGSIVRPHGVEGAVHVILEEHIGEAPKVLFLRIRDTLVPYFISTLVLDEDAAIVKFQEINNRDQAKEMRNTPLFLPQDSLPLQRKPMPFWARMAGYKVVDSALGELGPVSSVRTIMKRKLLTVSYQGQELLVPYNEAIVKQVDHERKVVVVALPEGFLEALL